MAFGEMSAGLLGDVPAIPAQTGVGASVCRLMQCPHRLNDVDLLSKRYVVHPLAEATSKVYCNRRLTVS